MRVVDLRGQGQLRAGDALYGLVAGALPVALLVVRHAHDAGKPLGKRFQHVGVLLRAVDLQVREAEHGPLAGKGEVDRARGAAPGNGLVKSRADGRVDERHGLELFGLGHHFRGHGKLGAEAGRDQNLGVVAEKLVAAFKRGKARAAPVHIHAADDIPGLDL